MKHSKKQFILAATVLIIAFIVSFSSAFAEENDIKLQYDDYYKIEDPQIISQNVSVGENVIEISDGELHAVGLGSAVISTERGIINVTVEKADLHIMLIMGQSNAGKSCGDPKTATACKKGTAYYWSSVNGAATELTTTNNFQSALAAEWIAQSEQAGSPEKVAVVHVNGVTYRDGVSITSDAPYDTTFGWINKADDGYVLSSKGSGSCDAFNNCYEYFSNSPFYNISNCGMYWFQGEHDANIDETAPEGQKYIQYFQNLWKLLKDNTENRLEYCAVFRVKGSGYPANYTLRFCSPLVAQYETVNELGDVYTASNITENWRAENPDITVDTSKYLSIEGNSRTYTFSQLYGYNKAHYYQPGYNILGADAAYNMYHSLHDPLADGVELLQREGNREGAVRLCTGANAAINLEDMDDFIIHLLPGTQAGSTLENRVLANGVDVTAFFVDRNGVFDAGSLAQISKTIPLKIVSVIFRDSREAGKVSFELNRTEKELPDFYHWDFTDGNAYSINENGGYTISSAEDGLKAGLSNKSRERISITENGLSYSGSAACDQLMFDEAIRLNSSKGYAIEFTVTLNSLSHGHIVLSDDPPTSGTATFVYFQEKNLQCIVLGHAGSLVHNTGLTNKQLLDKLTVRVEVHPDGTTATTVSGADFEKTVSGVLKKGKVPTFDLAVLLPVTSAAYNFEGTICDLKIYPELSDAECRISGHIPAASTLIRLVTCTENGHMIERCSVCGAVYAVKLPAPGHDIVHHDGKAATCMDEGCEAYDTCSRCDYTTYAVIPAKGHSYGAPTFTWNGYSSCTAVFGCAACSDKQSVACTVTSAVTKAATTFEAGVRTYTATVTFEGRTYTETKTESIPKLDDPNPGSGSSGSFFSKLLDTIRNIFKSLFGWLPFC